MGRRIAALGAAMVLGLLAPLMVTTPASAQKVSITDPHGDQGPYGYDIHSVVLDHRPDRVRITVDADRTPYIYYIRADLPGRAAWDYMIIWSGYYPRYLTVQTRKEFRAGSENFACQPRSSRFNSETVYLKVLRTCLGNPRGLRIRVDAWDDERGIVDGTRWTPWARSA